MKKRIVYLSLLSLISIAHKHAHAMDPYGHMQHGGGYGQQDGYYDQYGQWHPYNQPPAHYGQPYGYGYESQGHPGYQYLEQQAPVTHPAQETQQGLSLIHEAALNGDISDTTGLGYYLGKVQMPDTPDSEGHNALWYAVEGNSPTAVGYLLNNYANQYNLIDPAEASSRDTYLHRARSPYIATLLLSRGAPVNARNSAGLTALDQAFVSGNNDLVRTLINAGARIAGPHGLPMNAQNVIEAIYGSNPVLVDILLGRINELETTLQQQAPSGFWGGLAHLATGGANAAVNRAVEGLTPIMAALQQGSIPAVALLILNGLNLDPAGLRRLQQIAQSNGQEQIAALLQQVATARNSQEQQTIARSFLTRYRGAAPEGTETPDTNIYLDIQGHGQQVPADTHTRLSYQHQAPTAPGFGSFGGGSGR